MDKTNTLRFEDILEKYKIGKDHLVWICKMYNFTDLHIPVEFLESLKLVSMTSSNPTNTTLHQNYNFFDYKMYSVSIPLGKPSWIPEPIVKLASKQKLQLSEAADREVESMSTREGGKFISSEKNVLAYYVEEINSMDRLKRTEEEIVEHRTKVNEAIIAAKEKEEATTN